nr:MAG TPA: hypothetical protein [Caudoviricetes sp.]
MFSPNKVAPFFKSNRRKLILLTTFIIFIACGMLAPDSGKTSTTGGNATQAAQTAQDKEKQKENAQADAMNILGSVPQENDQVKNQTIYRPWGNGPVPADTNLYWYAVVKNKSVTERIKLVHFTSDINRVFWDKLIFSTDQGKWEYKINAFAGQSGDGKHTEVVMGGKYETLDVPYDKLRPGIKLLTEGTNPIIRMKGAQHQADFQVPQATIDQMKAAQQLDQDLTILGGKLK